jgi:integrase
MPPRQPSAGPRLEDVDGTMVSSLELVNSLPNGHIQTVSSMKYHSRELKAKGINFKYHYLRHTYGIHLADMNIPLHLLCNQMGHGKMETTRKYYIAVSEDGIAELKRGIELL